MAIIVAALSVVLFGVAALAVDIASQVDQKQEVRNQLDAAATAAAYYLDPGQSSLAQAVAQATAFYQKNGAGTLDPSNIDFWCVVAKDPTKDQPAWLQVPGVCNPDGKSSEPQFPMDAYQGETRAYDGRTFDMTCNATMCAIPCGLNATPANGWDPGNSLISASPVRSKPITCNTIRIGAARDVPFAFAPVIGVDKGSTGAQVAVACRGVCGQIAPNPMNVVVVTDRTASMGTANMNALVSGVKSMLMVMSPEQQYVSLAVIGRSGKTRRSDQTTCTNLKNASNTSGLWVATKFTNDYLKSDRSDVNTSSELVTALNCLPSQQSSGTYLASPLKAAARYVLGYDADSYNISSLENGVPRTGTVRNVIIFETDGQPFPSGTGSDNCGSVSLTGYVSGCGDGYDVFSNKDTTDITSISAPQPSTSSAVGSSYGSQYCEGSWRNQTCYNLSYNLRQATGTGMSAGDRDCQNFIDVANNFKAEDPTNMIVTVGFNLGATSCGSGASSPTTWLSGIAPQSGSWGSTTGTQERDCVADTSKDGSSPSEALTVKTNTCKVALSLTYTKLTSPDTSRLVTQTLAAGSGSEEDGPGLDDNGDHCATDESREVENTDDDLFFCAATGDQMAAIFQTIATKLTTGVKLINLPM